MSSHDFLAKVVQIWSEAGDEPDDYSETRAAKEEVWSQATENAGKIAWCGAELTPDPARFNVFASPLASFQPVLA